GGLPRQRLASIEHKGLSGLKRACGRGNPQHERLDWAGDVLQIESAKLLKRKIEPTMYMVTHRSRDTDSTRWALRLKPCRHIHSVAVQVRSVGNGITDVDADSKADSLIGRLIPIVDRNLFLDLDGTAHRSVYAVEDDQRGIAAGLDDPAAVFVECRVN